MKKLILSITLFAGVIAFALSAQAMILTFELDCEFSGATEPAGSKPWITATFDDAFVGSDDNTVRLTMTAGNLIGTEFIDDWFFNFNDTFDVTKLSFASVGTPGSTPNNIDTDQNNLMADGDGYFDIMFDFLPPPGNGDKFTTGETVIYDITYTSPIDVTAFDFTSDTGGGQGTYHSAAHIQGIGDLGNDSGWIGDCNGAPVPEPATILLVGTGLLGIIGFGRKRLNKKA